MNWADLQEALRVWVRDASGLADGRVIWAYPDNPQPLRPFAWLEVISGPTAMARFEERQDIQIMRERFTVDAANPGEYEIGIFTRDPDDEGNHYEYVAGGLDTVTTIRNELVALLQAEDDLVVTAIDDEDDNALQIEGTAARPVFHAQAFAGALTRTTIRDALRVTAYAPGELTLRVQVETSSQLPGSHARATMFAVQNALGFGSVLATLRADGLHYRRMFPPQDLTALVGDAHVSRVAQDFVFGLSLQSSRDKGWLRKAEYAATVGG